MTSSVPGGRSWLVDAVLRLRLALVPGHVVHDEERVGLHRGCWGFAPRVTRQSPSLCAVAIVTDPLF